MLVFWYFAHLIDVGKPDEVLPQRLQTLRIAPNRYTRLRVIVQTRPDTGSHPQSRRSGQLVIRFLVLDVPGFLRQVVQRFFPSPIARWQRRNSQLELVSSFGSVGHS